MDQRYEVKSISLKESGIVVIHGENDEDLQIFRSKDVLHLISGFRLMIIDKDVTDRSLVFSVAKLGEIDVKGVKNLYTVLNPLEVTTNRAAFVTKYQEVVERLSTEVFRDCCPCTGGGGTCVLCEVVNASPVADVIDCWDVDQVKDAQELICTGVTPEGIAYVPATILTTESYVATDLPALKALGTLDFVPPPNPVQIMRLDNTYEFPNVLVANNMFGNKHRFTDTEGNGSALLGAAEEWATHVFGAAEPNIVIDHLQGGDTPIIYWIDYVRNGTKFNLDTETPATFDTWENWVAFISTVVLGGYGGWMPIPVNNLFPHLAKCDFGSTWANNFFKTSEGRVSMLTGESITATEYMHLRDSLNVRLITAGSVGEGSFKAGGAGFVYRITNIFVWRKATKADVTKWLT